MKIQTQNRNMEDHTTYLCSHVDHMTFLMFFLYFSNFHLVTGRLL